MNLEDSCQSTDGISQVVASIGTVYCPECRFDWKLDNKVLQSTESHSYSYPNYLNTYSFIHIDPPNGSYSISVMITDTVTKCDTTYTRTLVRNCDATSGIAKLSHKTKLKIYPNPANDKVHIEGLKLSSKIRITDATGQEILFVREGNTLLLPGIANGLYVIEVETEGVVQRSKVTIQK